MAASNKFNNGPDKEIIKSSLAFASSKFLSLSTAPTGSISISKPENPKILAVK